MNPISRQPYQINKVLRLPANRVGKDFVVGDIHGEFHLLEEALEKIGFDPAVDRLFSVGDMIDRGRYSEKTFQWLEHPWFFGVLGNHEIMLLNSQRDSDLYKLWTEVHGGAWWLALDAEIRKYYLSLCASLPLVIDIAGDTESVGIVHANVPTELDWKEFVAEMEGGNATVQTNAIWGRNRVASNDDKPIAGVLRLFSGHTPLKAPKRLGNHFFLDTGAVYGGKLTVMWVRADLFVDNGDWVQIDNAKAAPLSHVRV